MLNTILRFSSCESIPLFFETDIYQNLSKHLKMLTLKKCQNRSTRNETIKFDFQHNGEIKLLLTNHPSLGLNIALIKSGGFQPRLCSRLYIRSAVAEQK